LIIISVCVARLSNSGRTVACLLHNLVLYYFWNFIILF